MRLLWELNGKNDVALLASVRHVRHSEIVYSFRVK